MPSRPSELKQVRVPADTADGIGEWLEALGWNESRLLRVLIDQGLRNPTDEMVEIRDLRRSIREQSEAVPA